MNRVHRCRLVFIRRAKLLGFTLEEIRELLGLTHPQGDRAQVKALTQHKLAQIDHRIEELRRMRAALADLDWQCSGHGAVEGCPIIEALGASTRNQPAGRRLTYA